MFLRVSSSFQSLFCWRRDSDLLLYSHPAHHYYRFQSLFCWRRDSDIKKVNSTVIWYYVSILVLLEKGFRQRCFLYLLFPQYRFNPCFVGEGIQTIFGKQAWFQPSEFQSLFCWRRDSDKSIRVFQTLHPKCFNPCFVGEGIQTWLDRTEMKIRVAVSILVLLEKGFRLNPSVPITPRIFSFQSLFCWRRDSDVFRHWLIGLSLPVSILVLLEKGFRHDQLRRNLIRIDSFNPCFVGEGIQTFDPFGECHYVLLFQSLFCWRRDSDSLI